MRRGETKVIEEERSPSLRWYHEKIVERRERGRVATKKWRNSPEGESWYKTNREKILRQMTDAALRKNYGVSLEWYEWKFSAQGRRCEICGKRPKTKRRFPVDHNHKKKKARGIICAPCNHGLFFLENRVWKQKALRYLERYK